jgi:hypothetical protein
MTGYYALSMINFNSGFTVNNQDLLTHINKRNTVVVFVFVEIDMTGFMDGCFGKTFKLIGIKR